MSELPQECNSTLNALEHEAAQYERVIVATRNLGFPREEVSKALLLIEIEDLARKELGNIRAVIDNNLDSESESNPTTAPKRQLLSAAPLLHNPSNTRDISSQEHIYQPQALPTLASLHLELPNFPLQIMRQISPQTDNHTHDGTFPSQNWQNLEDPTWQITEEHQRMGLQIQQEQQQKQDQELLEEIVDHQ
ncbi:hypothetical protein HYALB_00002212 [Hymenoscyphus albidus]|uniref:Uncharacterized protein n=1 Tax=Hymenoscyphus albidus TaxID=595503 RepID=A0A9N9LJC3_9HELO|nr:hypothetical protein HYALB_00002212 [Hymenoscyphus albidus]